MLRRSLAVPATTAMLFTSLAHAQSTEELSSICTDRPTKSNFACVVDTGHFQVETDLLNGTRVIVNGARTDTLLLTNPTLKYGLAKDIDIEVNVAPRVVVNSRDSSGLTSSERGVGDTTLRLKWNFLNSADGRWSATVLPFVKAPTAKRGIGNRAVEGGVLFPVNHKLSDDITLTTVPEFDTLLDADGSGRHLSTSQLINVGIALPKNLTLYAELWGSWNRDPAGLVRQASADVALTWGMSKLLQFDVGLNLGLNRDTPGVQAYFGVSQKF